MTHDSSFADYAARLRAFIEISSAGYAAFAPRAPETSEARFDSLALELFDLQFKHNLPFQKVCAARGVSTATVAGWREIPCLPTAAFKDLEVTCWPAAERIVSFHSSGTTGQTSSRHFHNAASLALYEASLLPWFEVHLIPDRWTRCQGNLAAPSPSLRLLALTPPASLTPRSSLVHMFEIVRREFGSADSVFVGEVSGEGIWSLNAAECFAQIESAVAAQKPLLILGTAFSFVHLLDALVGEDRCFRLPAGSRVLETGGYKGRSREIPKPELHALITERLGISSDHIVCEYGMSELSSQAYDRIVGTSVRQRIFRFPPWARARVVSPESGREVADGEAGLIQVYDLANLGSVLAVQTEDLGVRRGGGFELLGRAAPAEPRGCSLMQIG